MLDDYSPTASGFQGGLRANSRFFESQVIVVKYADTVTSSFSPLMHPWDLLPKGDLNDDGRLTPADAAIALQLAASGAHDDAADVSGDGSVTSLDALMILQAAAGAINL